MKIFHKVKLWLAPFLAAALALGIAIPLALAANPLITNVTYSPDPFYFNVPNQNALINFAYDYNTGGYATGPVTEQIWNAQDQVVYEWGQYGADTKTTGHYALTWDGKYKTGGSNDGQYVPDGQYRLYIYSLTASPPAAVYKSPAFTAAKCVASTLAMISQPPATYYTNGGGLYTLNYKLTAGTSNIVKVELKIKGPLNNNPTEQVVNTNANNADGNYTISWNGQINNANAPAGSYQWTLYSISSVNGFSVDGTTLTGNFNVSTQSAPNPTVGSLSANPNPFDPNTGLITFSYTLNGSLGTTDINTAIYNVNDLNTVVKKWDFPSQASGTNSITWDGKNTSSNKVDDGSYIFKVWGTDGNFSLIPQQIGFTVQKSTTPPPASNCAGFGDIQSNDPNCAAITYMKSIGAMTGGPNGNFDQYGLLQRDQVAKIILQTFNKFNSQFDYCLSVNPFPDVTENNWSFQYICRGKSLGMITGYKTGVDAGYYRPARSVNRVEFLALLMRNLSDTMPDISSSSYSDVATGQWFSGYAKYSYDHSLFTGSRLYPTNFTTRLEVAQTIYKLHQLGKV